MFTESIETIRYSKKKRPDEHTIHNIRHKKRNLIKVKLADINDRLAFLIKEGKLKNQPSNDKNSNFVMSNNPDASEETVSQNDDATSTTSTFPCADDLNSKKEDIIVLNTEITTM